MMKGKTKFLPPRYMSVSVAAEQLIEAETTHGEGSYDVNKTLCIGLARMGQPTQQMVAGTLEELKDVDMGGPLHSLIICGELHDLELDIVREFLLEGSAYELETNLGEGKSTEEGENAEEGEDVPATKEDESSS